MNVPANRRALFSSRSEHWQTPDDVVALATLVLGGIALDPCATRIEPGHTCADRAFTHDDDGLAQDWFGSVYLNPPYGRALPIWIAKFVGEISAGHTTIGLALVPARTDTRWWRQITEPDAGYHSAALFFSGRLKFTDPTQPADYVAQSAPFPSALVLASASLPLFVAARARLIPVARSFGALWHAEA